MKRNVILSTIIGAMATYLPFWRWTNTLAQATGAGVIAIVGEDGKCYIDNCDILQEAANTEVAYFVFLQKCGKGDLWVSQKTPTYFVVEGTPGLSFAWEVKIKQTGYEYLRYNNDACDTNVGFRETDYLSQMEQEIEALYEDMEEITL